MVKYSLVLVFLIRERLPSLQYPEIDQITMTTVTGPAGVESGTTDLAVQSATCELPHFSYLYITRILSQGRRLNCVDLQKEKKNLNEKTKMNLKLVLKFYFNIFPKLYEYLS